MVKKKFSSLPWHNVSSAGHCLGKPKWQESSFYMLLAFLLYEPRDQGKQEHRLWCSKLTVCNMSCGIFHSLLLTFHQTEPHQQLFPEKCRKFNTSNIPHFIKLSSQKSRKYDWIRSRFISARYFLQ